MHRLRIELGGKRKNLLARDAARSESAEMAGWKIFEGERHDGDCRREARLWPLFAAISTCRLAWLVPCGRTPCFGVRHCSCLGQLSERGPLSLARFLP